MYETVELSLEEIRKLKQQQSLAAPELTVVELTNAYQRELERVRILRVALQRLLVSGDEQSARVALEVTE